MYTPFTLTQSNISVIVIGGRDPRTTRLFNKAFRFRLPRAIQQTLGRPGHRLNDLKSVEGRHNRRYGGLQTIAIDCVHGSLNRVDDFDYDFHPLKQSDRERWCRVAAAMMNGVELPPIEVVQVEDEYYVKDGHRRVSVARALSCGYLDAVVEVWS